MDPDYTKTTEKSVKPSSAGVYFRKDDEGHLAKQLPYLLERLPSLSFSGELMEIPSNAPSSLPSPPLFPGEVLRMRQHRVVCMGISNEPLVGVVYLTNFRIIFNGLPIKSPEVYDILKEMQFTGSTGGGSFSGSSKDTLGVGGATQNGLGDNSSASNTSGGGFTPSFGRTFRKKKFSSNPAPKGSNFYLGDDIDGSIAPSIQEDSTNEALHSKVIKKISTLTRSSADNSSHKPLQEQSSLTASKRASKPVAISLPLSHVPDVSASVPNHPQKHQEIPPPEKCVTLPRPVTSTHQSDNGGQPLPQQFYDSGFIDPPLSKPTSMENQLDNPPTTTPAEGDEFLMSSEVDFEKPIKLDINTDSDGGDQDTTVRLRKKRNRFSLKHRPDSIIAVDSDSDSDSASDKYFGSIPEDEDSTEDNLSNTTTSPDSVLSPTRRSEGNAPQFNELLEEKQGVEFRPPPVVKPRPLTRVSIQSNESHPLRESFSNSMKRESSQLSTSVATPTSPTTTPTPPTTPTVPPVAPKPRKPPRRKNKFQNSSSSVDIQEDNIISSTSSSNNSTSSNDGGTFKQQVKVTPEEDDDCEDTVFKENPKPLSKPLVKPRPSRDSIRRPPPLPPPAPPSSSTCGQSTVVMETENQPRHHPIATAEQSALEENETSIEDMGRISQTSMIPNCPSNASLMKRFTLSTVATNNDRYSSFGWCQSSNSIDKKSAFNTWSGSGISAKSIPYIHYSHSSSISLRSLRTIKLLPSLTISDVGLKLPDGVVLVSSAFSSLKLYLHPLNTFDSSKFKDLLENTLAYQQPIYSCFAFKYRSAIKVPNPHFFDSRKLSNFFSFEAEVQRMGILNAKVENSQIWRVTHVTKEHPDLCRSYPEKLIVLLCTPDMDLLRGASVYQEGRFPTACWIDKNTESVLLRGAATISERGQHGSKLPIDEAILHAIRKCNNHGLLFVFTEKSEAAGFQDPTKLTIDAARSYFYHNCQFTYTINPPTFKSVRHSFNKLQAMVLNNISDDDYLMALDSTRWLSRISELLQTTGQVCRALKVNKGHVLVCYESGWDRTTQIVSLAQLLCDPYYRTMDGFQVLIQKEWVWFGHPFGHRNGHLKSRIKSEGPVFLQWLDCVYQVMHQFPLAFEFNESLLMALLDQSYSDQFGTFLMNSERERQQRFMVPDHYHQSVHSNTVSIWSWISLMNASNQVFYNVLYDKDFHQGVIYPKYHATCLKLWRNCYERDKVHMELQETGYDDLLKSDLNQLLSLYYDRVRNVSNDPHSTVISGSSSSPTPTSSLDDIGPSPVPFGKTLSRTKSEKTFSSISEYLINEAKLDPSICHHVTMSGTICQGYLIKEGGVMKTWKKRWFVLDYRNAYFAYFETEEHFKRKNDPKGVITLSQIQRVVYPSKREHLVYNLFQVKTPTRLYSMKAPSITSMEIWVACLKLPPSALK